MRYHPSAVLLAHGVRMPAPESVFVGVEVALENIAREDVTLHPFARVEGADTILSRGVEIGTHGPAYVRDSAFGAGAKVASGSVEQTTLMDGASLGPDAHARAGTILEEGAGSGHAVGVKQTILMAFATLGSNLNFCDCLMTGGRSRSDHSEVGSGFIHFNFTPAGDKATASLFGTVPRGVLLNANRVFLGGAGGVVGPVEIGFGTTLAAGAVYRRDHGEDLLVVGEDLPPRVRTANTATQRRVTDKLRKTGRYLGQVRALRTWYSAVRQKRAGTTHEQAVIRHAIRNLDLIERERVLHAEKLVEAAGGNAEWHALKTRVSQNVAVEIPAVINAALARAGDHVAWVRALNAAEAEAVTAWLDNIANGIASGSPTAG